MLNGAFSVAFYLPSSTLLQMAMALHKPPPRVPGILVTLVWASNRRKELYGEANHRTVTSIWLVNVNNSSTATHPAKAIAQNIPPKLVAFATS